ncbi:MULTISPECIES: carbonic anhydrase [unclassified Streptomyces]|uniref:carbonic anhydrase n=1 Tax=unclassified Streptomyces TaxID=2593676 RepID=UPI0033B4E56D
MQYLIDQARVFPARAAAHGLDLGGRTHGRRPRALFVSCSDARIVPALLTGSRPGDLFELRTYGGLIPRFHPQKPTGESRTIDHAVRDLDVTDIIVCGHSHCEITDAALDEGDPSVQTSAGQWHIVSQLDVLSGYPCVTPRLADRSLRLHAWFYEVDTGATLQYQPRASAFLPL